MKKIGILTFHNVLNYGAILQTYALQKSISKNNAAEVNIVDYRSLILTYNYSYKKLLNRPLTLIPKALILHRKKKVFSNFMRTYLNLSEVKYNKFNIKDANKNYDVFIVGSDQVWNYNITYNDTTYLLDFSDEGKKYSYAASIGLSKIETEYEQTYFDHLSKFNNISVRELEGQKIIENQLKLSKSRVNVDPTLLLGNKEWDELTSQRKIKERYILVYTIKYSKELISIANRIAKENGCKVVFISSRILKDVKSVSNPSVNEFLSLFKYAEFTIVNSFHGTIFSIIFQKKFIVELAYKDGRNSRIVNLLSKCDISDRILTEKPSLNINDEIDWVKVEKVISIERALALQYLNGICEGSL